jgi:RNA polymerase-binding protein DksA
MAPAATKKATGTKADKPAASKASADKPAKALATQQASAARRATAKSAPAKAAPAGAAPRASASPEKTTAAKTTAAKTTAVKTTAVKTTAATKAAPGKKAPRKKTVICPLSGFEVTPSAPGLAPRTKERLKAKLLEEKARLLHQAEELIAEAEELAREREAGDTQFDEESGEGDTIAVERERDLLLSAQARHVVEEIDAALARMKRGTYGVCSYAGRKIPLERLEAIPWADVCVDCKARAERRR